MVLRRAAVYGSQSGRSGVRGLPVRAKAIHASWGDQEISGQTQPSIFRSD